MRKRGRLCPVALAGSLDSGLRRLLHNQKRLLRNYVKEGMVALDVGCGPGLFTRGMARFVGDSGKVIAVDMQDGMLKILKEKIQGTELEKRIKLHKCPEDRLGVSEKVDFVLAFYVVHEVPDDAAFYREVKSLLKQNGTFFVIEPKFHVTKSEFEETINRAASNGFKIIKRPRVLLSWAAVLEKK
jgi:ubiquinone/menaquinone biosynthesis C-methylase UbiE